MKPEEKTAEDSDFIMHALNFYWNDAHSNLQRKDLGDIERKNYQYQLDNSKRLMTSNQSLSSYKAELRGKIEALRKDLPSSLSTENEFLKGNYNGQYEAFTKIIGILIP